jgi:hypothetical protein
MKSRGIRRAVEGSRRLAVARIRPDTCGVNEMAKSQRGKVERLEELMVKVLVVYTCLSSCS